MSESALPLDIEQVPEFEVPEGVVMPDLVPMYMDEMRGTYSTNNLHAYFRAIATNADPQEDTYANILENNPDLSEVFKGFSLGYPRLSAKISELQREKVQLDADLRVENPEPTASEAWSSWQYEHVRSGEQAFLMSEAFKAMVPDLVANNISPISVTV